MSSRKCQACRDRKDPRVEKVQKGRSVIGDHQECRVPGETGGAKGLLGRADHALVQMRGERGIVRNQGRKGGKGEKGESAKASQASVVPQTNWKQCVWKSDSGTDNGKIKVNKKRALSRLS